MSTASTSTASTPTASTPRLGRLALVGTIGLLFTLGCMCGDAMEGFQEGSSEGLSSSFSDAKARVEALPAQPTKIPTLMMTVQGEKDAAAGSLPLIDASVWIGQLDAAIADQTITPEELGELQQTYQEMPGASALPTRGGGGGAAPAGKAGKAGKAPR